MRQTIREYWAELKKFDLETIVIIIYSTSVLLFVYFLPRTRFILPGDTFLERLMVVGAIYIVTPLLIFFLFRHRPEDFGISIGKPRLWSRDVLLFYIVFLVILVVAFKFTNLKHVYPLYRKPARGMQYFFFFQLIQLWYMLGWEFFFRGFMLFGLERKFGRMAVLVQAIPFAVAHFKKPQLEAYGAIFAGIFLGLIGLRARSFLPCFLLHYAILLTADVLGLLL